MSDSTSRSSDQDEVGEGHEGDVQDDGAIEQALRLSLMVFIVGMVPVIGLLIYLNVRARKETSVEQEMEAPTERLVDEATLPSIILTDVTAEAGVDFVHYAGKQGQKLLPETMGGSVAVFDYNGDDYQDLLFVNSCDWPWNSTKVPSPCRLYRGNGELQFADVTEEADSM